MGGNASLRECLGIVWNASLWSALLAVLIHVTVRPVVWQAWGMPLVVGVVVTVVLVAADRHVYGSKR